MMGFYVKVCARGVADGPHVVPAVPLLLLRERGGQPHEHGRHHHQQVRGH